jgi:hypothetical protein
MGEEPLRDDKISILNGVLELNTKHVEEIMTPMEVSAIHLFHFQVRRASLHFEHSIVRYDVPLDVLKLLCIFTFIQLQFPTFDLKSISRVTILRYMYPNETSCGLTSCTGRGEAVCGHAVGRQTPLPASYRPV